MAQSVSPNLPPEKQREMLRRMLTIRHFEERASADYLAGKIYGVVHCYIGEEAVAVGVCSALGQGDRIISTHRGHGHCIAKGADLNRMMAELYGRQTGYCKGKGGSMHIADFGIGMLGANGIVAGGIRSSPARGWRRRWRQGRGRGVVFRRRRVECRPVPRMPQHRGDLESADALRLRKQHVCREHRGRRDPRVERCGGARRRLRHSRHRRRRQRHLRGPSGGQPRRRAGALGRRPDLDRMQDLPLARPHRAPRAGRSPRPGGGRGWKEKDPIALLERRLREQGDLDDAGPASDGARHHGCAGGRRRLAEASPFPLPEQATDDVFAA